MQSYEEYCPIAMGAEAIGDRWTPLVLRELICGSERFSDIHRGVPRMSRTLLAKRLRQLERLEILERTDSGGYRLTQSGHELEQVVWSLGDWAMQWLLGDPAKEHYDGTHLMWRLRQRVVEEALPDDRTVVQFDLRGAERGRRTWLLLDPSGSTVCERDEGFEVDLWVDADIHEFLRVWMGRSTWQEAMERGEIMVHGPSELTRGFTKWFALSPFAQR
ncbi:MAG: winged helix-turn-helix transcriptional regulator [Acidimicrobiales bacterium]